MPGSSARSRSSAIGALAACGLSLAPLLSCRDLSAFSTTDGDSYLGPVVNASFVLAGMGPNTKLCLTLDTDHLQDTPGSVSTDDGTFSKTPMRPIPQIWHDPLSTFSFGDGRVKNLLYVSTSSAGSDIFVVVSLMQSGTIEVRLLRGAPGLAPVADSGPPESNLFAVFDLQRQEGACSF
jgi:hypothetical protein